MPPPREDPENLHEFSSACGATTHAISSGLLASAQHRQKYAGEGPVTPVVLGSLLKELLTPAVKVGTKASQMLAQIPWLYVVGSPRYLISLSPEERQCSYRTTNSWRDNWQRSPLAVDLWIVREIITYAMVETRIDIAFATSRGVALQKTQDQDHFSAVDQILRYFAGSPERGYYISNFTSLDAQILTGQEIMIQIDRKSTSGFVFTLNGEPISYDSKKQAVVALSSTEAEY